MGLERRASLNNQLLPKAGGRGQKAEGRRQKAEGRRARLTTLGFEPFVLSSSIFVVLFDRVKKNELVEE